MNFLAKAYYVARYLGPGFVARRLLLDIKKRLGITRRLFGPRPWNTIALSEILSDGVPHDADAYAAYKMSHLPPFLFAFGSPPSLPSHCLDAPSERSPSLRERIALLKADRCVYFFHQLSPEPIDWYHNPFEDTRAPRDRVWCDIPDFEPSQGDPRVMWEPSRCAWAFDLAMAAARGMDEPLKEVYWRWVDSWMTACPPFNGLQWKCGQESSVRLIALLTGFWALGPESGKDAERWMQMARLAWATGYRVAHHIDYAVSQNNNHALSEACGLILIAHLFPELRLAREWEEVGRRVLVEGMRRQIYSDGSYIQHSMNYHRVMLQVCTLAMRIGELAGKRFPVACYEQLARATQFLYQMSDAVTGKTPHYGNDDGALVLPLSECAFHDVRPAVQSAHFLVHGKRLVGPGPWDEEVLWIHGVRDFGEVAEGEGIRSSAFRVGGYYTLRTPSSWVMARAHRYRDRPGQYDPLHVDLWWNGVNVLCDRGTYRYYFQTDPSVETAFRSLGAHNTIEVDEESPERWLGRFLQVPYSHADCLEYRTENTPLVWSARLHDYVRRSWRVSVTRTVVCCSESLWVIVDDVVGAGRHRVTLRWQLPEGPATLRDGGAAVEMETPRGPITMRLGAKGNSKLAVDLVVGRREGDRAIGFSAPHYNSLVVAPTLQVTLGDVVPMRLVTCVYLGEGVRDTGLEVDESGRELRIQSRGDSALVNLDSMQQGFPRVIVTRPEARH